jgi:phasin family protein
MTSAKSKAIKDTDVVTETSGATDTNQSDTVTTTIETSDQATSKSTDDTLQVTNVGVEKAAKGLEASHVKLTEILEKTVKNSVEILAFNQGTLEAVIKSTRIYSTGFQDISKQLTASGKATVDESVAFTRSLVGVKSGKEAFELQTGFIKASIENAVSERKKIIDAMVKLAEQAFAPLNTRFRLALETFGKTQTGIITD